MPREFKVGDRFVVIKSTDNRGIKVGMTGVIKCFKDNGFYRMGLMFDQGFEDGHNLQGNCPFGRGWWIHTEGIYQDWLEIAFTEHKEKSKPTNGFYKFQQRINHV